MLVSMVLSLSARMMAEDRIRGQVLGGGAPIAQSTVTLLGASADKPKQLLARMVGAVGSTNNCHLRQGSWSG